MTFERPEEGSQEMWLKVVKAITGDTSKKTIIDLCCNLCGNSRCLDFASMTAVDIIPRELALPRVQFVEANVLDGHAVLRQWFDVALCCDGIEHLQRDDGFRLLSRMKRIADTSVVFTPLGDYMVEKDNPSPEAHHSAWMPEDFISAGYEVVTFPNWHKALDRGAIWAWVSHDPASTNERVKHL